MHIILILFYILFAYLVGLLGKDRKFGFYGYFFLSLFLTPLIGLILVFASDKRVNK